MLPSLLTEISVHEKDMRLSPKFVSADQLIGSLMEACRSLLELDTVCQGHRQDCFVPDIHVVSLGAVSTSDTVWRNKEGFCKFASPLFVKK